MAVPTSQPISSLFPVTVTVAPLGSPGPTFNQALIVGSSTVIPSVGANSRVQLYNSLAAMITAGFLATYPEYLAASIYFAQTPQPTNGVWIGRQDLTAIATVTVGASGGTGYTDGDILTVVQVGASAGQVKATVTGGVVTGASIIAGSQGTGYSVASNLSTTGGTGSGCEINITAIGETPLQAMQACRLATTAWYASMFVGTAADSDHEAIAGFIEAASPFSTYFYTTGEASALAGLSSSLPGVLKAAAYRRSFGIYATTQGGTMAPNNIYAAAGPMGQAMARNTGTAGSYFALAHKTIAGVIPEPLTATQITALAGSVDRSQPGLNCNVYISYNAGAYLFLEYGTMASGAFFDEILQLDMLASDVQTSVANFFGSQGAVPIDNDGISQVRNVINGACQRSQTRGFIAPAGTWQGVTIGGGTSQAITAGTPLPTGYTVYAPAASTLSQAQKAARQMPPIVVLLIEAGSGLSQAVSIQVQQ